MTNDERLHNWREAYAYATGRRPLITRHHAQVFKGLSFPVSRDSSGYLALTPLDPVIADNLWRLG